MSISFNAEEVFQLAEQIERNGAKFYRRASKSFSEPAIQKVLLDLASMELDHERVFAEMKADFVRAKGKTMVVDPYDEGVLYLRAIADGHVFDVKVDPSERLRGREKGSDILRMAIGLEKDSVVFYQGIREIVPEELGKDRVEAVIKEEMKHITQLSRQLASLVE